MTPASQHGWQKKSMQTLVTKLGPRAPPQHPHHALGWQLLSSCRRCWGRADKHFCGLLTPNTSVLQSLDAGLIRALKAHYRQLISQLILNELDETEESISAKTLARKIYLHNSVIMLDQAWKEMKDASMRNEKLLEQVPLDFQPMWRRGRWGSFGRRKSSRFRPSNLQACHGWGHCGRGAWGVWPWSGTWGQWGWGQWARQRSATFPSRDQESMGHAAEGALPPWIWEFWAAKGLQFRS